MEGQMMNGRLVLTLVAFLVRSVTPVAAQPRNPSIESDNSTATRDGRGAAKPPREVVLVADLNPGLAYAPGGITPGIALVVPRTSKTAIEVYFAAGAHGKGPWSSIEGLHGYFG